MEKEIKKSLSSREAVTRDLRIFVSAGTVNERKEIRRSRITNFRDDRPLCYNGNAFTLIELLVVVLIIGILAAVALPQYQKAVWKARFTQAKTMTKSLAEAEEVYYLANGEYTLDPEALSIELPGATCAMDGNYMRCTTSWGQCSLAVHAVNCKVYKNGAKYMSLNWWLDHSDYPGTRTCVVYNTNLNDIGNQICKQETNRSSPNNTYSTYVSWGYR